MRCGATFKVQLDLSPSLVVARSWLPKLFVEVDGAAATDSLTIKGRGGRVLATVPREPRKGALGPATVRASPTAFTDR